MDERTLLLRRGGRVLSVWLFICRVWSLDKKVIVFLIWWTPEPMSQDPCYSNHSYSTNPLQTLSRRPSLRRHFLLPWKQRREEGEEEKRRKRKLGHVVVNPHRSSPKTGWGSSPLSVFPISMAFPCFLWSCRLVWCSAPRLDARKKGKQSGITIVVAVIAVTFVLFKGKL